MRRASIDLRLSGAPSLRAAGRADHPLERHDAALLALLAFDGAMARGHLAQLLWPHATAARAATNLRQRLFRLKRVAGASIIEGDTELRLAASVAHDLDIGTEDERAHDELLAGVRFENHPELSEWLDRARAAWHERWLGNLADLAASAERAGDLPRALRLVQRLLALGSAPESVHQHAIRLHYLMGDRAGALAAYRDCETQLHADLGVEPGAATRALLELALQDQQPSLARETSAAVALLRPPRMVGRQAQCAAAEQALNSGAIVLVEGEPGIGKSRLLSELAERRHPCVRVTAELADATQPYALLTKLLRAITRACGEPTTDWVHRELQAIDPGPRVAPSPSAGGTRLAAAVGEVLTHAAQRRLALIVLDDLHHADALSLRALLPHLLSDRAVPSVLAVRSGEAPAELDACLIDERVYALRLAALTHEGLDELVRSLGLPTTWTDALWRHTGGHPLFALQTLLACTPQQRCADPEASLPVPAHMGQLIDRRVARLSAPALRLAQLAAVSGSSFSVPFAAALLGAHAIDLAPAWHEVEATQIMRDAAFAHDLIRDAVLRTLPALVLEELHAQVARLGPSFGMLAQRQALHLQRAGQPGPAARLHAQAAREAAQRGAWLAALQLWDQAALCQREAGDADLAFAAERAAAAIALEVCDADEASRRIGVLQRRAAGDGQRAQALVLVARNAAAHSRFDDAQRAATDALSAGAALSPADAVHAAGLQGLSLAALERTDEALAVFERYEAQLQRLDDRWTRSEFRAAQGYAFAQRDYLRQAVASWQEAAAGAIEVGRVGDAVVNLNNAAGTSSYLGQFEQALALAERALQLQKSLDGPHTLAQASATMLMGTLHTALGRFAQAQRVLQRALHDWQGDASKVWRVVAENCLGNLYLMLGQPARARQMLVTPVQPGESGYSRRQVLLVRMNARSTEHRRGLQLAFERPAPSDRAIGRLGVLLAQAVLAPVPQRLKDLRDVMREAEEREHLSVLQHALAREADTLRQLDRAADAAGSARRAIAMADASCVPHDLYVGEFWWFVHQALDAAGARVDALAALRRGEAWVREQALPHVPEAFRDSFVNRNPANRLLLAAAQRARNSRSGGGGTPSGNVLWT
jgi:DNA-binding SARP family transcriptional activator